MKIPRIKLPDKNLISLREFISDSRVRHHSPGPGRFKLNLGKNDNISQSNFAAHQLSITENQIKQEREICGAL